MTMLSLNSRTYWGWAGSNIWRSLYRSAVVQACLNIADMSSRSPLFVLYEMLLFSC